MWEPPMLAKKLTKIVKKNLNISSNNGPIELGDGLLDRYEQALQFRGIKLFHPSESYLWESKNSLKFSKKCQKLEYLLK